MDDDLGGRIRGSAIAWPVLFGSVLVLAGLLLTLSPVLLGLHLSFLAVGLVLQCTVAVWAAVAVGDEVTRARRVRVRAADL